MTPAPALGPARGFLCLLSQGTATPQGPENLPQRQPWPSILRDRLTPRRPQRWGRAGGCRCTSKFPHSPQIKILSQPRTQAPFPHVSKFPYSQKILSNPRTQAPFPHISKFPYSQKKSSLSPAFRRLSPTPKGLSIGDDLLTRTSPNRLPSALRGSGWGMLWAGASPMGQPGWSRLQSQIKPQFPQERRSQGRNSSSSSRLFSSQLAPSPSPPFHPTLTILSS